MTNQQILDSAPSGATHIDGEGDFCKEGYFYWCTRHNYGDHPEAWIPDEFIVGNRSLADIRRIVELEGVLRDITNEAKEVLTNARNTPAVRMQLEMSGSIKHYIVPRHSIISAENYLKEQGE